MKRKRKRGRPTRAEASRKALATVDPTAADPRLILQTIAVDTSAPATARVAACRALLGGDQPKPPGADDDPVTALALKLLRGKAS